jgi:hypothetical protein
LSSFVNTPFTVAEWALGKHVKSMKSSTCDDLFCGNIFSGLASLGLCCLLIGCASTRIDWNGRIDVYNYDQAVTELGPPDRFAKLTDGTIVAEWMTRRGYSGGPVGMSYGYGYPSDFHPWPSYYYEPSSPDYFIRLTFGPGGKLQACKRVAR